VAIWYWIQKLGERRRLGVRKGRDPLPPRIVLDETWVQVGARPAWIFTALDPATWKILYVEPFFSRNEQTTLEFLEHLAQLYGAWPKEIITDGGVWYRAVLPWLGWKKKFEWRVVRGGVRSAIEGFFGEFLKWLDIAYIAGETLLKVMEERADYAYWPFGPDDSRSWPHWCNGTSGVGTALIRLYKVTEEQDFLHAAREAANTVMREKWRHNLGQCHGLAGNGEFLLDLFEATKDEKFLSWAGKLAKIIYMNRIYYQGKCVFPGEGMMRLQADYGTGMAGIGCFLLRCWQGGLRPFMIDRLFSAQEGGG